MPDNAGLRPKEDTMRYYLILIAAVCSFSGCLDAYAPPVCNPSDSRDFCTTPLYQTTEYDCNGIDRTAHAGAEEICDGLDNDCDGQTDTRRCETACGFGGQVCDENRVWGACNAPVPTEDDLCGGMS